MQRAFMPPHHAHHRGQTQTPAGELGGEERIENARQRLGVHPATRIAHLKRDVFAGRHAIRRNHLVDITLADLFQARDDPNRFGLPFLDGLGGVDDQIHDELLDLSGIAFDRWHVILQLQPQLDSPGNRSVQQAGDLAGELG